MNALGAHFKTRGFTIFGVCLNSTSSFLLDCILWSGCREGGGECRKERRRREEEEREGEGGKRGRRKEREEEEREGKEGMMPQFSITSFLYHKRLWDIKIRDSSCQVDHSSRAHCLQGLSEGPQMEQVLEEGLVGKTQQSAISLGPLVQRKNTQQLIFTHTRVWKDFTECLH